jgi:hypothetical protein
LKDGYKAHIKVSDSIKRQQQKTSKTNQPIRNFFYRIVPAHHPQPRPILPPPQPNVQLIINNRQNLITTTLGQFFQRIAPVVMAPHIPIPTNDDYPP